MEIPRHWRLRKQRYAMVGSICPTCQTPQFPPRAVCPTCAAAAQRQDARIAAPLLLERPELSRR